ncbi:MAG: OstA-like protein [candidate division WOR-3 bacterium]
MIFLLLFLSTTPFRADRVEIVKQNGETIVYLLGNVEIEQEETKITCYEAQLNETRGLVLLNDRVLIEDNNGKIYADDAIYYLEEKMAILRKNVRLISENQIIVADSLNYDSSKRFVRMYRNVYLEDTKNKVVAYGGEGWYDLNSEIGSLNKQPKIEITREGKTPMIINAREFLLKNKEEICFGYDSVIGVIDSIILFCDTMAFDMKRDNGYMNNPLVVEKNNELKGATGEFGLKNKKIDYFKVFSGYASYWTNEGAHNLIEGTSINVLFQDGKAFKVLVEGNPKGKLYLKEEKENAGD